jgi:hypothetical protein
MINILGIGRDLKRSLDRTTPRVCLIGTKIVGQVVPFVVKNFPTRRGRKSWSKPLVDYLTNLISTVYVSVFSPPRSHELSVPPARLFCEEVVDWFMVRF